MLLLQLVAIGFDLAAQIRNIHFQHLAKGVQTDGIPLHDVEVDFPNRCRSLADERKCASLHFGSQLQIAETFLLFIHKTLVYNCFTKFRILGFRRKRNANCW